MYHLFLKTIVYLIYQILSVHLVSVFSYKVPNYPDNYVFEPVILIICIHLSR